MTTLLIKNGTIVTAADQYDADIVIENEKIKLIGLNLSDADNTINADNIIDAAGCFLFPGGIDPHVHMELRLAGTVSADTFESGSRAALFGGTTTIIDFAMQEKGGSLGEALCALKAKAAGNTYCDYAFHLGVVDFHESAKAEIKQLIEDEGVPSFKVFTAYKNIVMLEDRSIAALMKEAGRHGGFYRL